jgi:peptidoglycan pentaglycine glycine transferase (the first glycine)
LGYALVKLTTWVERDAAKWDLFVESAAYRSFSQLWQWGELRREAGWSPVRLAVGDRDDEAQAILAGAQVMVRRVPLLRTALGYVPRGPVGWVEDDQVWSELLSGLRRLAVSNGIATLRVEPEASPDSRLGARLTARFWRTAPSVQPKVTRVLNLRRSEDELREDLRKKHRQYIAKAERDGVTTQRISADADPEAVGEALADFHRILSETGERAHFNTRPEDYYRRVWDALAPEGRAHLFFAARDGRRVATLFHISCGDHVAELYGGATPEGARTHANYLVKWSAILALKESGFAVYDLWGEPTGGIAQFKEGFGGERIEFVGARDLTVNLAGDVAVRVALATRAAAVGVGTAVQRLRQTDGATPEGFRETSESDGPAWQSFVETQPSGDVLHDWEWAAVAAFDGTQQRRFVLEEHGAVVAVCAAQIRRTALGRTFWYVPRGPVLDYQDPAAEDRLARLVAGIRLIAKRDRAIAVRIEPRVERESSAATLFDNVGLTRVDATLQTPDTRLVDLTLEDDALIATFDKDTRYAIRRSAREGVETSVIDDPDDDEALQGLHGIVTETLDRASYKVPSLERYRLIWRGLAGAGRARIIQAWYQGRLESAALLVVEGDRSIYLYAGSIREAKGEPRRFPSYAAQWRMMQTAREMGAKVHDLWGVAPEGAGPDHPWYGYSLFKKGFDGRFVSWAGSWDLVVARVMYSVREFASRRNHGSH